MLRYQFFFSNLLFFFVSYKSSTLAFFFALVSSYIVHGNTLDVDFIESIANIFEYISRFALHDRDQRSKKLSEYYQSCGYHGEFILPYRE